MALFLGTSKIANLGGGLPVVYCNSFEEYKSLEHNPNTIYITPAGISPDAMDDIGHQHWEYVSADTSSLVLQHTEPLSSQYAELSDLAQSVDMSDYAVSEVLAPITSADSIPTALGKLDKRTADLISQVKNFTTVSKTDLVNRVANIAYTEIGIGSYLIIATTGYIEQNSDYPGAAVKFSINTKNDVHDASIVLIPIFTNKAGTDNPLNPFYIEQDHHTGITSLTVQHGKETQIADGYSQSVWVGIALSRFNRSVSTVTGLVENGIFTADE